MSDMTKPMAHAEAETIKAVDLYLLNELPDEQRMRFEEHYFDCATCAEAVEAGQIFVHAIRPAPESVPWWRKLPARLASPSVPLWRHCALGGIAALSVIGIVWQQWSVVSPIKARLLAPQANTIILARELEKGDGEDKTYRVTTPSVTVEFNLPPDVAFSSYRVSIECDHKTLSQIIPGPVDEFDRRLSVQIAREALGSGHSAVRVEGLKDGQPNSKVGQYHFTLRN